MALTQIIASLLKHHGQRPPPNANGAWELILHENVAYLVDDERREKVWEALRKQIGIDPTQLLQADLDGVADVIRDGGMQPERRAEKLQKCAKLAIDECDGDVDAVADLPAAQARRKLKLFPGIGDPGADRLLMFTKRAAVLALDSNGLRALLRLGYGQESPNYAATYKSVQSAVAGEIKKEPGWLIQAHLLLRNHGQTVCRRSKPLCDECPLARQCPTAQK